MSFLDLYEGDQAQTAKIQPTEGTRLPTGFEQNFGAAWSDGRLFGQSIAGFNARSAVLSDYLSDVKQKTGADLTEQMYPNGGEGGAPQDYDAINARIAELKQKNPNLDLQPLSDDEVDKRAVAKAQSAHRDYEAMQAGEKGAGGGIGTFLGSAAAAATDPINILALGVAPETGGSVSILASALKWGALAGASQAAIEASSSAFKEQVQPGYTESGQPFSEVAGAFAGGAVTGGVFKALGNAWTRAKTGTWPTSVRDAGNVIESEAHVAQTNPFPGVEGEVAHREAVVKTIDDILANRPVSIDHIITPDFLERSRALTERLQTEEPMRLPVINRRAIELAAEHEQLTARDAELATTLEKLPAGDISAADRLNRLQAVEQQIAGTTDRDALRALNERRDQILVDTNPEKLQAAAAPIEQRRVAEAERGQIAARLEDIQTEHARAQADQALLGIKLPPLGERQRIPTGPKGQFEMDLQPPEGKTVRFYHGGTEPTSGGPRWLTPYEDYARNFRATAGGNEVHFVDIPETEMHTSPDLASGYDEVNSFDGKHRYRNFEAPERIAQQLQPLGERGAIPPLQTTEDMAKTLTDPAHQDAIRADIDRARALGDIKVPHMDENGVHSMRSVDAAMDEVDAFKTAAEQIQACANPVQEAAE